DYYCQVWDGGSDVLF
nr:immunoglobulin light chain junction region [Macaca mulatta]